MKLPQHYFPLIPKRRVVSPHMGSRHREPETQQLDRNQYRGSMHGNINPWITQQLKRDEQFNITLSGQ